MSGVRDDHPIRAVHEQIDGFQYCLTDQYILTQYVSVLPGFTALNLEADRTADAGRNPASIRERTNGLASDRQAELPDHLCRNNRSRRSLGKSRAVFLRGVLEDGVNEMSPSHPLCQLTGDVVGYPRFPTDLRRPRI